MTGVPDKFLRPGTVLRMRESTYSIPVGALVTLLRPIYEDEQLARVWKVYCYQTRSETEVYVAAPGGMFAREWELVE